MLWESAKKREVQQFCFATLRSISLILQCLRGSGAQNSEATTLKRTFGFHEVRDAPSTILVEATERDRTDLQCASLDTYASCEASSAAPTSRTASRVASDSSNRSLQAWRYLKRLTTF